MNKLISFTGGKPDFNIDDLLWNDEADRDALNDIFRVFGDNYIIYGVTGTTSITAGYIMLDGELLKVDAHTKSSTHFVKVTTYDTGGDAVFNDGTSRQTWQENRATITAGSGSLAYASASRLEDLLTVGDWQDPSYNPNFSNSAINFKYRLNKGKLEFKGKITSSAATGVAFTLPAAYRPSNDIGLIFNANDTAQIFYVRSTGDVDSQQWDVGADNEFNNSIIID